MAEHTGIEWTDATWNAVTGCTEVSAGCDSCYARTLSERLQRMGNPKYRDGFAVRLHEGALTLPLKWKEPRRIFVNSMSDAFHVDVPRDFLDKMFAVMALCPQHTFQVLTKRPQRAFHYLSDDEVIDRILAAIRSGIMPLGGRAIGPSWDQWARFHRGEMSDGLVWPLSNVWLGTSVEDNRVRHRISALRRAPAAVHFLSCEPLIGPLDLAGGYLDHIEWVIAGGESGHGYRPLNLDWARRIRDDCARARVAYLFKQVGGLTPKSGGRLLDGVTHDEFPERAVAR